MTAKVCKQMVGVSPFQIVMCCQCDCTGDCKMAILTMKLAMKTSQRACCHGPNNKQSRQGQLPSRLQTLERFYMIGLHRTPKSYCQKLKDVWNGAADAAVCKVDTCNVTGTAVGEVFA